MNYASTQRIRISSLAIACLIAFTVNGAMLMGFDHLAHTPAAICASATPQLAEAARATAHASLYARAGLRSEALPNRPS